MGARRSALVWLERALVIVGLVCLAYYGYVSAEVRQFQREQTAAFESRRGSAAAPDPVATAPSARRLMASPARPAPTGPPLPPAALGLLDIPRLSLSAPVLSGDDAATLDRAIGHLPDTPLPWQASGNSALAAHRDGLFRPLRNIRVGDEVRLTTLHGDFTYRVRETKIVRPTDLSVLAPTDEPTLTLITCYPFNFVGNAPKRFIVHAVRSPAEAPSDHNRGAHRRIEPEAELAAKQQ